MSLQGFPPPPLFLLVEDDPDDPRLLRHAVQALAVPVLMDVVESADGALAYLRRKKALAVLSDVHLRGPSGFDLLARIRGDDELKRLPVLLWTSLPNPDGRRQALALGARRYLGKPSDLAGYRRVAALLAKYLGD
jgi:CheY-like chemotaxis protein